MRKLFSPIVVLTSIVLATCSLLWFRTTSRADALEGDWLGKSRVITSIAGGVEVAVMPLLTQPLELRWTTIPLNKAFSLWPRQLLPGIETPQTGVTIYFVPYWIPTVVSAVMPVLWCIYWVRRRSRHTHGRCEYCGYDLRESPERCPECGTVSVLPGR